MKIEIVRKETRKEEARLAGTLLEQKIRTKRKRIALFGTLFTFSFGVAIAFCGLEIYGNTISLINLFYIFMGALLWMGAMMFMWMRAIEIPLSIGLDDGRWLAVADLTPIPGRYDTYKTVNGAEITIVTSDYAQNGFLASVTSGEVKNVPWNVPGRTSKDIKREEHMRRSLGEGNAESKWDAGSKSWVDTGWRLGSRVC